MHMYYTLQFPAWNFTPKYCKQTLVRCTARQYLITLTFTLKWHDQYAKIPPCICDFIKMPQKHIEIIKASIHQINITYQIYYSVINMHVLLTQGKSIIPIFTKEKGSVNTARVLLSIISTCMSSRLYHWSKGQLSLVYH